MSMENWKFAVKSAQEVKEKGLGCSYHILTNGVNSYTGETEEDYIAKGYAVLSEEEFDALNAEHERFICGQWKEITEEEYDDALNVLPPALWKNGGFFMSERYTGTISSFYQEINGKYYTSLQDMKTPRQKIIADLEKFIMRTP